jgi:hypothetical protein
MSELPQWKCAICGQISAVGRCHGIYSRTPVNRTARQALSAEFGEKPWLTDISQDVDGFHYYFPPQNGGCLSAHTMRQIADAIDEMDRPWREKIEKELKP